MDFDVIRQLVTALALGTLIGLERERRDTHVKSGRKTRFAGIRTFALMALFGVITVLVSKDLPALFFVLTTGFFLLVIAAYIAHAMITKSAGATTEFAALFVYFIGVLCAQENYMIATIIALILLAVLHFKDPLHHLAESVSKEEISSTMKFMIIAFVVLPLLPNKGFGPYEIFNPYIIWLMVVFISGMSFVSYIAIKIIGEKRGIGLTGFLGGFISSTALTISFSEQSKENKGIINPYVFAVVIASSAMFFRVLVEVFVLNRELFNQLLYPMIAMGATGLAGAYYFMQKREGAGEKHDIQKSALALKSPFQLKPALQFGAIFALILLISKTAQTFFGNQGLYFTSFFAGLVDVDAITVSMASLAKENGTSIATASFAVTVSAMANTLSKGIIFFLFGNRRVAQNIAVVFAIMLAAGTATLIIL